MQERYFVETMQLDVDITVLIFMMSTRCSFQTQNNTRAKYFLVKLSKQRKVFSFRVLVRIIGENELLGF